MPFINHSGKYIEINFNMKIPFFSSFFSGKYFEEISQDTGKYCFGVVDTLKALECGAVEILICWENLDIVR